MNIQKFTQKSVEAINDCEKLAYEYGNQEIEQEHLFSRPVTSGRWTDSKINRENGDPERTFCG